MAINKLTVKWNEANDSYILDIADENGVPIAQGLAVVTGLDLLEQFDYLRFGVQLIVQTDHDPDAVPTYENLGKAGHIYVRSP